MLTPKPKRILGMTYLQFSLLIGGVVFVKFIGGCGLIFSLVNLIEMTTNVSQPINTPVQEVLIDEDGALPAHSVNDFWDNGNGTNFTYFIVADKSMTRQEAEALITYYKDKHEGFKLINIYIYCDERYASVEFWDAKDYSGGFGEEVFKYIMYWYQTGEWSKSGGFFMTKPNDDYPTFGSACK